MLLHNNKRILLCTGNMLYNIHLQVRFRVITVSSITVFGVGELDGKGLGKIKSTQ